MDIKTAMRKISINKDGIDHIWVSPFAGTQLGRIVSLNWRKKFFIPRLGEFVSPDSFAAWVISGDDSQRYNSAVKFPHLSKEEFNIVNKAIFIGKYHQLASLRSVLKAECEKDEGKKLSLPWVEYKQHLGGIKEYHPNTKRVSIIKDMCVHIINNGPKVPFKNDDFDYIEAKSLLMEYIKEKFNLQGTEETEETDKE